MTIVDMFVDEQQNALMTALCNAARADNLMDNDAVYTYLDETPKTSFVVEITQELNKLGYKIVKK